MPEKIRAEIRNTVQEAVTKSIPKKCKRAKWLSEEALRITEKKRSKRQGRKGKIYPTTHRENSKEREEKSS